MGIVYKLTFYCYSDSSFTICFPLQCVPGMSRDIYNAYLKEAKCRRRHIDKSIKAQQLYHHEMLNSFWFRIYSKKYWQSRFCSCVLEITEGQSCSSTCDLLCLAIWILEFLIFLGPYSCFIHLLTWLTWKHHRGSQNTFADESQEHILWSLLAVRKFCAQSYRKTLLIPNVVGVWGHQLLSIHNIQRKFGQKKQKFA